MISTRPLASINLEFQQLYQLLKRGADVDNPHTPFQRRVKPRNYHLQTLCAGW